MEVDFNLFKVSTQVQGTHTHILNLYFWLWHVTLMKQVVIALFKVYVPIFLLYVWWHGLLAMEVNFKWFKVCAPVQGMHNNICTFHFSLWHSALTIEVVVPSIQECAPILSHYFWWHAIHTIAVGMNLFKICKLIQDARTRGFTFCIWLWHSPLRIQVVSALFMVSAPIFSLYFW